MLIPPKISFEMKCKWGQTMRALVNFNKILLLTILILVVQACNSRIEKNPRTEPEISESPQNIPESEEPAQTEVDQNIPSPTPDQENDPAPKPPSSEELLIAVRSIIQERCIRCHSSDALEDLSTVAGIMFYVTPGLPEKSPLWKSLRNNGGTMPRGRGAGPIPEPESNLIRDWIISLQPDLSINN